MGEVGNLIAELTRINESIQSNPNDIDTETSNNIDANINEAISKIRQLAQSNTDNQTRKRKRVASDIATEATKVVLRKMEKKQMINEVHKILNMLIPMDDAGTYSVNDPYDNPFQLNDAKKMYVCHRLFMELNRLTVEFNNVQSLEPNLLNELKMGIFMWGVTKYAKLKEVAQLAGQHLKKITAIMTTAGLLYMYVPQSMRSLFEGIPYVGSMFSFLNTIQPTIATGQILISITASTGIILKMSGLEPSDVIRELIPICQQVKTSIISRIQQTVGRTIGNICSKFLDVYLGVNFNDSIGFDGYNISPEIIPSLAQVIESNTQATLSQDSSVGPNINLDDLAGINSKLTQMLAGLKQDFSATLSQAEEQYTQMTQISSQHSQSGFHGLDLDDDGFESKSQLGGRRRRTKRRRTRRRRHNKYCTCKCRRRRRR